jgi:hypothetical protein
MLLTVAQFREHVADEVALNDDVLRIMLDANEQAIEKRVGPPYQATETVYAAGLTRLPLLSEPLSITLVTDIYLDSATELTDTDYRIRGAGVERTTGVWGQRTTVEYVPKNEAANRIVVLVQLMKCDLNYEPGVFSQSGGGAFEQYSGNHLVEREVILDRLGAGLLFA